jgi:hypothetical protein
MNKFKIANTIIALFTVVIIALAFSSVEKPTMEPITDFTDVELAKGETCRLEILLPIAKTLDGVGVIFADEGGNLWEMTDFYAEENDVFVALMNDKGTEDKTDDEIVDIWLDLE